MKILFIPLEFLRWQEARAMAYTAQLALEEGFRHHNVELTTLPAWGNVPSSAPVSWLSRAKELLDGQTFDQIWVTLVHSPLDDQLLSWLATLAPVRVGFIIESLTYTAEECALHPPFKDRRAYVERQMRTFTHVLAEDEFDVEQINANKLASAAWWPNPVPARSIATSPRDPTSAPAQFYGSVYGGRIGWMENSDLRQLLVRPSPPEDAAGLPPRFDALQARVVQLLQSGEGISRAHLDSYLADWRQIRAEIFDCWMAALRRGSAQVNLPTFIKAYSPRVVESIAAGCPVISWDVPNRPRNRALYRDGEEILFFRRDQPAELISLIRRVRQEPDWAMAIAERALRKVRTYHSVEQHIQQVFHWIATGTPPDYGENPTPAPTPKTVNTPPDNHSDSFYIDLFVKSPNWSSPAPNADEMARWTRIEVFVRELATRQKEDGAPPLRILDLGCGRGWLTHLLAQYGQAEGVEPVAGVIDHAKTLFPQLPFRAGNADAILNAPDFAPYDLVVSSEVIEHVPEAEKAGFAAKLARLLKPGGHAILTTPRGEALEEWTKLVGDPSQPVEDWLTEGRLAQLFVSQGFQNAGIERVWFDVAARAFVNGSPDVEPGRFLAIYQVCVFQAPGGAARTEPAPSPVPAAETSAFDPAQPNYQNTPASALRPCFDYQLLSPAAPPAVTIVTPFFNANALFYETAASVFRQSLQQWEWLLVNDGSTEPEALRLLEKFRQKDPRIRVLNHPRNLGLSAARNTGFKQARAPFIFQLDADDLIEPTTLEKMAWHLATHPEPAFTTGFTVGFGSKEYLWRNGFHGGAAFLQENLVTATCLIRKSVHQAIGGYDEQNRRGLEDWEFWLKAAAHGYWGSTIGEFFDWYRRRDTGREHWGNVVDGDKTARFQARLKQLYPKLWQQFPQINVAPAVALSFGKPLPFENKLGKKKPRLLYVVPHFELGGADKFNLDLVRQLQRERGYEITVVATRKSANPWQAAFESLTPDVFVLNSFLGASDYAQFLRYLIVSRQPDAVCVSNSMLGYQLLPCLRSWFPDLPFVDYLHMEQEEWMDGGYPRCSLNQRSQLARTAVSSQHLKKWMVARGTDPDAIEVCTTNIDCERWRRDRFDVAALAKKWTVDKSNPVVLYAGRICDQKQPAVFAEVIRQTARKHPAFTVLVAGDGPDLSWLKTFADKERLPQVRFLGAVANNLMPELLALSDIFFLPSQWEGISLAIYEAMAMEVVPLGAAVGGQAELVSADCGILVRHGANEVSDYTTALLKLLRSPQERLRMARNSRARVEQKFPIADLGRRMGEVFQTAQAVAAARRNEQVLPHDLATLHAGAITDETRARECADTLSRQRDELIPYMKHSLEWQSLCRAGQALAEAAQPDPAIAMFEKAAKAARDSRNVEIFLAAGVEIARGLAPLDAGRAEALLREADGIAVKFGTPSLRAPVALELAALRDHPSKSKPAPPAPVVSVVIPCYQQAVYLPEAVDSVVAQTFAAWEIIVVNDGSPDNTSDTARALIAKYPGRHIRLVEQANSGLPAARNAGIRASRGRYILPLDADDKLAPAMLEKLVAVLEAQPKVGFAYPHIRHFGALQTEYPLPDFDRETLIARDNIACVSSLFRKTAWEQAGGYNETMREGYEDWDFWISCVEQGWEGHCVHEPLFLYRKHANSMLTDANRKREKLIASIVRNHPKLYAPETRTWADTTLGKRAEQPVVIPVASARARSLRVTYLVSSILGVTGGNQTLLRQAEEMRRRGHDVTIVTYTPKPDWFQFKTRVIQAPAGDPMSRHAPPSDVVVATYFANAPELPAIQAPVKVYYAQGDQFIFGDTDMADTPQNRQLRELSRASYLLPGIRFVPNSHNLAQAVEKLCGRKPDGILPVCTDQTIFRPLQRSLPGSRFRLLIVGPDARGTEAEPLLFKGIHDIHEALQILTRRFPHFTAVRMSATGPDIFARFPCEFYIAPSDEMKTALYGTSHIHIYASHYDSCPRPPQEAMAAGCAVVCTATPGAMEYCRDGENSLLVPVRSPHAIADAVERLIRDHALREKLVNGGLATAGEFPREREWNEWEAMLQRFVADRGSATPAPARGGAGEPVSIQTTPPRKAAIALPACARVGFLGSARALFGEKKFPAAWEAAIAALHTRPHHPEACLLLAQIAQSAGDSVSARRCVQHAVMLAPNWKPARRFAKTNFRGNTRHDWLVLPDALRGDHSAPAPRLSVCLIVKNEEKFLSQCLASIRDIARQIVVVDTGSNDQTVAIAKEYGAEVYEFAWTDDFSAARNAALERATGDWVLMLDADEELSEASCQVLQAHLADPAVIAWRLPIIDAGRESEGCCYVPRLYRNAPGLFYIGRVHEQVFTSIEVRRQEWGLENRLGEAPLLHHGYRPEVVKDRNKIERNLRLLETAILEMPDEPNLLMNYGLELARSGQADAGLDQYRKAFELMSAQPGSLIVPETREMLLSQFCTQLIAFRRYAEIIRVLRSPLAEAGGLTASLHFALGLAHLELKQFGEAADQMRQCLEKRGQPSLAPINPDIRKAGPHHCLALCLAHANDPAALAEFQAAVQDDPHSIPARYDLARHMSTHQQPVEALNLLFEMANQQPGFAPVWHLGAHIALSRPEFLEVALDWTNEARRHHPGDAAILRYRAEVLLLAGKCDEALPLWREVVNGAQANATTRAALVLCETALNDSQFSPETSAEPHVSGEFVKWYQRVIQYNGRATIDAVNARLDSLAIRLPSAANVLRQALAEATV
jgi:glycosyltransferase involved in cell wall biosynthesis/SAM-dependent methyltransferase